MKALYATAVVTGILFASGVAQAKTYRLYYCGHQPGRNYYKVTASSPGCSFGKASYNAMMHFGVSSRHHGEVGVAYRARIYKLNCFLTSHGEGVECEHGSVPWVVLFLDSAEAPPSAFE